MVRGRACGWHRNLYFIILDKEVITACTVALWACRRQGKRGLNSGPNGTNPRGLRRRMLNVESRALTGPCVGDRLKTLLTVECNQLI